MEENSNELNGDGVEIQALAVAVQILDLLASQRKRVSAAEIARCLNMTPPRVWRHLKSMQALGLVDTRTGERGFVLGGRLVQLGHCAADQINVSEAAHPHLVELRDTLAETVYLVVPYKYGGTVVLSLDGEAQVSLHLSVGTYFPGHASASGRVLLAFSSAERIRRFLQTDLSVDAVPNPIFDRTELSDRYERIRQRFFDTAQSEHAMLTSGTVFVNGIAAPIFDHGNNIAAAVGVLTGIRGEDRVSAPEIKTPLFRCAAAVSAALGATRWRDSGLLADMSAA